MYEKLFSPIAIRGMELKNRVVMPAMGTKLSRERHVTQALIDYHLARALGGTALNMVEVASVHAPSAPDGFLGIHDDACVPGLERLVDAIHSGGGKAGIQLWQGAVNVIWDESAEICVPSETPVMTLHGMETVPGISVGKIAEVVRAYGEAARRAAEAGFDCVEFHAGHNYLPHMFLSPAFNHREDEYGGSFENRVRFPLEAIEAIRANIRSDMPLFMRFDAYDEQLEGGMDMEETIRFCELAGQAGVDVLNVSRGNTSSGAIIYEVPPLDVPRAFNIGNAGIIRQRTGMLVAGAGRINDPELAERILETEKVDLVCIGRGQLADPKFCVKAESGREREILRCVGCNQGCYDLFCDFSAPHISCMRNPAVGREADCALVPTERPKKVAVVGGGVGGMEAAMVLAKRGHDVHLYEANAQLGGQFSIAGKAPHKEEMDWADKDMAQQVFASSVRVHLGVQPTPAILDELSPEFVINATGATPVVPPISGADLDFVKLANDVLLGKERLAGDVVVVGGGLVGIEAAEYLAEAGCRVTVVEMLDDYGNGLGILRRICADRLIDDLGIDVRTGVEVTAITPAGVDCVIDGEAVRLPADYVVVAVGSRPKDSSGLAGYCRSHGIGYEAVGDAKAARRAIDAIREGFEVALRL